MRIQLVEDDSIYIKIIEHMFMDVEGFVVSAVEQIDDLKKISGLKDVDLVLVDVNRPDSESLEGDVKRVRKYISAPLVFMTYGETSHLRDEAIRSGADAVIDKSDMSEGLIRQMALNGKSRKLRHEATSETMAFRPNAELSALNAPLAYLESGLATLGEVMRDTGKTGSSEFVEHLKETIQAIKQYSEDDLSEQHGGSIENVIQQSYARIQQYAEAQKINLRVDGEEAGFRHIGSNRLVQLGVQHLLEGVLRCCRPNDGLWMQGEKAEESGSSVIHVHLSRSVLPSGEILFPGAAPTAKIGLDALSSLQLGSLLLALSPQQVKLVTENKAQMLSIYL